LTATLNSSELLKGQKILVTGGSRGIGASIARELAAEGASVALTYVSREDAALEVLKSLPGAGHLAIQMNVSDEASVEKAIEQLMAAWSQIDGVVNNAGVTKDTLLLRMKTEDFENVLDTNLKGTFLVTRGVLKPMIKARKGSIVNITSVIGQTGNAGQSNYAASKGGVVAFSKSVAAEVASRGIRVNCVAPGFINTEMTGVLTDEQKKTIMGEIPLGRIAEAQEVAQAVSFLLSGRASYITGHTLSVNGGMFME
jgi:3-oxoacyl-[acyl-carrier protein] reductase